MAHHTGADGRPLRILHIMRAPLGGLFRHVLDLTRGQIARGHAVGIVADSSTGGETADRLLAGLEPGLALGLSRVPMRRNPAPSDLRAFAHIVSRLGRSAPDVVHGHGSKGGLFARTAVLPGTAPGCICVYTPHGGSLNYRATPLIEQTYLGVERLLARRTDLALFESAYIADRYRLRVGPPRGLARVVHNGIGRAEFTPVVARPDAVEFLYVGELRAAKGIDTLLDALALVGRQIDPPPRAVLVGSGPDEEALGAQAAALGLGERIRFAGPLPARQAFERGRILVVPSRAESLPYIVLEAAGAQKPTIATDVGGIPEIFGPYRDRLMPPDDAPALAARMKAMLALPESRLSLDAGDLARHVEAHFSVEAMVDGVLDAYRDALARRSLPERPALPSFAPFSR